VDVLRGLAALGVFVFHLQFFAQFPAKRTLPPVTVLGRTFTHVPNVLSLGASGVSLFFVISGFVLALQQWRSAGGMEALSIGIYARNRVARIVPAYWFALLISVVQTGIAGMPRRWPTPSDVVMHMFFLHGFSGKTFLSINGALWSMATETQFYIVFPLLLVVYARWGGARLVLVTGLFNAVFRIIMSLLPGAEATFGGSITLEALVGMQLPGRLWEFVLGMYLADLMRNRGHAPRLSFGWFLLGVGPLALVVRGVGPQPLAEMALGLAYFGLLGWVLRAASGPDGAAMLMLAAFGRSSYSFFLLHWPVLEMTRHLHFESGPYARFLILLLITLPTTVTASALTYRFVELPIWNRLRARVQRV
jgi:peptidoglycan/LPS O-acetylase OafA/YrhL